MDNPSFTMPEWMIEEVERRRAKGTNRSEYVREAIMARFDAEDAGEWADPDVEPPEREAVADGGEPDAD